MSASSNDWILDDVVAEHAEEAAFLWQQREMAVRAPDFELSDIVEWDRRLEAHLDGLRIAGERGWEIGREIGWSEGGEYFTAMTQAIDQRQPEWVLAVLEAAADDRAATRGVVSAFGWVDPTRLRGLVKKLLDDERPHRRQVGLGACAVHRANPGNVLERALADRHDGLRARALKAAGELGAEPYLDAVEACLEDEDDEARFWAAWSGVLLGSDPARKVLALFAAVDNPRQRQALDLLMRVLPPEEAQQWLRRLARERSQVRWAVVGSGMQGDPAFLGPLMKQFGNDELARVAGEAFQSITGLNIFRHSLEVLEFEDAPAEIDLDADEGADEVPAEDQGLVVPDPDKMAAWWAENGDRFESGQRYLGGEPVSHEQCERVLRAGLQRQRTGAALELALERPTAILFETRAPGPRQQRALGSG